MKKQKGFGLLEILITLVLLGVGVAGLVSLAKGMLGTARKAGATRSPCGSPSLG